MQQLNHSRRKGDLPAVKPCEVFDLIGGTSTGGLIAIMLGRLEMDVDECIEKYTSLMEEVFRKQRVWLPFNWRGNIEARFDSDRLAYAVKQVVLEKEGVETSPLDDGKSNRCKVFVCATAKETRMTTRLRSYKLADELCIDATVLEAALATSAATSFFKPIQIGARTFVDGALGANNPVEEVEREATNIWCSTSANLKPLVKCFISIGTGNPGKKALEDSAPKFAKALVDLATETERTAERCLERWRVEFEGNRYFRFNIDHGLEGVGLEEFQQRGLLEASADEYLRSQEQKIRLRECVANLQVRSSLTGDPPQEMRPFFERSPLPSPRTQQCPQRLWLVPFLRNPRFVGRTTELAALESKLFGTRHPPKVAITGLGGIGKTQVAVEFAYRITENHPDLSVFWVVATNTENWVNSYREIAEHLKIGATFNDDEDIKTTVKNYLSHEYEGQWLMIVDNADDLDLIVSNPTSTSRSLFDDLPQSSCGRLLVTTRNLKVATKLVRNNIIYIPDMTEDLAQELLRSSLVHPDLLHNAEATSEMLKRLALLPLALVQAAAFMNENSATVEDYLGLLEDAREVDDLLGEDFEDDTRYDYCRNAVITTWLISFEQIQRRNELAAQYLSFIACLDPKNIPMALLPVSSSKKILLEAIGTLAAYSFVTRHRNNEFMDVHRLVHLATRNWLRKEGKLEHWQKAAMNRLTEVLPTPSFDNMPLWIHYLPHAEQAIEYEATTMGVGEESWHKFPLYEKVGACLLTNGRYADAEVLLRESRDWREKTLGPCHITTFECAINLGRALNCTGKFVVAEGLATKVLEQMSASQASHQPLTLECLSILAESFRNQGRWDEAHKLNRELFEKRKEALGPDNRDTLCSMSDLAETLRNQGCFKEAEELNKEVLARRRLVLGPRHQSTLGSMLNLAATYWNQGRLQQAEELELTVLQERERSLGSNHPDVIKSMANLAVTYWEQGNLKSAEELEVQVMESNKKILGTGHPRTLKSMSNLAETYRTQGRLSEAQDLHWEVWNRRVELLGEDHPATLKSKHHLAEAKRQQGDYREAEQLHEYVCKKRQAIVGLNHPETLRSMNSLAATYHMQNRGSEAQTLYEEVIKRRQRILGAEHPDTLASIASLAQVSRTVTQTSLMEVKADCLARK
ncbi:hypothetical protein ABOM_002049 [Aspergillus bombycis]|uniref:PNPLA domain-containing protein n=1 Tax=Aspergillus bombycis TaxID=109264 RepID=A0A1F8AA97_9EURO|nr:hypothetical protein ABOM_002049 [Aspergillus bombycis]OGM48646.1 hypothetical protein ABOM_002049 [Aspergillus bombycis]